MILNFFSNIILFSMPGGGEWILIIIAILLLFGGKKIPELMRGVGKGMREFNDAKNNVKNEIESGMNEKDKKEKEAEAELRLAQENLTQAQSKVQQAHLQTELPK